MKILVNGECRDVCGSTVSSILGELGYTDQRVATAVNEVFVAAADRARHAMVAGDRLEVVAPRQGG